MRGSVLERIADVRYLSTRSNSCLIIAPDARTCLHS